jgi:uncharacterized protein (TIGR00255 family)
MTQTTSFNSMTGFARAASQWRNQPFAWELKSVNGKALDLRFRVPPGFEAVEAAARSIAAQHIKRGNVQINLTWQSLDQSQALRINHALLNMLVAEAEALRDKLGSAPIQAEHLLGLRGVLDSNEATLDEAASKERDASVLKAFESAVQDLLKNRSDEGTRLAQVIAAQLQHVENLTTEARNNPSRSVDAIRQRLSEQVKRLLEQADSFDVQRLHQEAILLATRADIQEELDRLSSHIAAARALLAAAEPVGRKFDFLAQEFNREANTLCSKANDPSLTRIGLDLKTVIDQMREQIQNVE